MSLKIEEAALSVALLGVGAGAVTAGINCDTPGQRSDAAESPDGQCDKLKEEFKNAVSEYGKDIQWYCRHERQLYIDIADIRLKIANQCAGEVDMALYDQTFHGVRHQLEDLGCVVKGNAEPADLKSKESARVADLEKCEPWKVKFRSSLDEFGNWTFNVSNFKAPPNHKCGQNTRIYLEAADARENVSRHCGDEVDLAAYDLVYRGLEKELKEHTCIEEKKSDDVAADKGNQALPAHG